MPSCLLIAMPQLADPNFLHTTTLLSEFNREGAMGVILNRPLGVPVNRLTHENAPIPGPSDIPAFWGGPVQNERGFLIHETEEFADAGHAIEPGLFLTGSSDVLRQLMERQADPHPPRFRLFLGYAGWGPGQLEREIAAASWLTAPVHRDFVFDALPATIWNRSIARLGIDPASLASVPQDQAN